MKLLSRTTIRIRRILSLLARAVIVFALTAGQWSGQYAPWALSAVALSGSGLPGLAATVGSAVGGLFFFPLHAGLRHAAASLLLCAAALAFGDYSFSRHLWFRPVLAMVSPLLVYLPAQLGQSLSSWLLYCAAAGCSGFLTYRGSVGNGRDRTILLLLGFSAALLPLDVDGFSPGIVCGAWLVLLQPGREGIGLLTGLALDLVSPGPTFLLTSSLAAGAEAARHCRRRWVAAAAFFSSAAAIGLLARQTNGAAYLFELVVAVCAYLCTPTRFSVRKEEQSMQVQPTSLRQGAQAFHALYRCLSQSPEAKPENPAVLFDRAAEAVCGPCPACHSCWRSRRTMYNAFNCACTPMLRRGRALQEDFPDSFRIHCLHFNDLLSAINTELYGFLLRRQSFLRLQELRSTAALQYAQMSEVLEGTVTCRAANQASDCFELDTSLLLRPRSGESLCGDQAACFSVGQTLYLLLSDGMGSGEAAHAESALMVRLLRQFLEAGIEPLPALKTLNTAMHLRCDESGSFTTIDLLSVQRVSGSVALYKYGAAASYVKKGNHITRFAASALPVGLQDMAEAPEITRLHLSEGMVLLLTSDGITQNGDDWLQSLLSGYTGNAEALARKIMDDSLRHGGEADDCAVLVLRVIAPSKNAPKRV